PSLPRLDLSWSRHHRDPELSLIEQTNVQRNARMSYGLGKLDLYAGYGDLSRSGFGSSRIALDQRNASTGASFHVAPTSALSIGMQYDFGYYVHGLSAAHRLHSLLHTASLGTALKTSSHATWNLGYNFRRTDTR